MTTEVMPRRTLGSSDLQVSVVGLGTNNFGRRVGLEGTRAVIDAALDAGVNFLDTADIYGGRGASEELIGEVLAGRRDQVVLATKWGMDMGDELPRIPRGSRDYIRQAIDGSLRRLRTDRVDLYQYHQPDEVTPIEETLETLAELRDEGKIRHAGCSNFSAAQLREAQEKAGELGVPGFVTLQNEYSLLKRGIEKDVVPECERWNVSVLPYFPLASGVLTGKYRRGEPAPDGTRLAARSQVADDATFDRLEALEPYARERGLTPLEVAIAGLAAQPMVASVIAGATKPEQIRANAAAARWTPTAEDLAELDRIFPSPRG